MSRRIKCHRVAHHFSHECVDIGADFGMGLLNVTRTLDRAARFPGYPPKEVRTGNGLEISCLVFLTWTQKHGTKHVLIEPACSNQNAYIESFNGTLRY